MKLPFQSIRWRIQAWHGLLLLLVLAGFGAMAYRLQSTSEARHLDGELQLRVSALLGNIAHQPRPAQPRGEEEEPGPPGRPPERDPGHGPRAGTFRLRPELAPLFAPDGDATFYYRLWTRDGEVFGTSADAPADLRRPERAAGGVVFRRVDGRREAIEFTPPGESALVGISEMAQGREMRRFAVKLALVGAGSSRTSS